jgi:hypothetical protein
MTPVEFDKLWTDIDGRLALHGRLPQRLGNKRDPVWRFDPETTDRVVLVPGAADAVLQRDRQSADFAAFKGRKQLGDDIPAWRKSRQEASTNEDRRGDSVRRASAARSRPALAGAAGDEVALWARGAPLPRSPRDRAAGGRATRSSSMSPTRRHCSC